MSGGAYFHHGRPSSRGGGSPLMLGGYRQWRSWTSVDSSSDSDHLAGSAEPPSVRITLDKSSTTPISDQISGWVELKRNETYCGLIVELIGFYSNSDASYPILPTNSCKIFQRFSGTGVKGDTLTSRALSKFPFELNLPTNCALPPTFKTKMGRQVQYYLRVSEERGTSENPQLGRKIILYGGRLTLTDSPHLSPPRKEITLDGVTVALEIGKHEFLLGESIPFTISSQGDSSVVKRVKISLTRTISHSLRLTRSEEHESDVQITTESEILDCVVFRRFLKRETFTRSGKLLQGKDPLIPTFLSSNDLHLMIRYVVQMKLTTKGHNVEVKEMEVIVGTEAALQPELDPGQETLPSSGLNPCPPNYSQLSSRVGSQVSMETMPPAYEEI